jgi:UDP-N-acetyl-D-glucosamine dehydrogenase
MQNLINNFKNKKANVAVIGMGYVGLPLALEFAEAGFNVNGIDIDQKKINVLNQGKSHVIDIDSSRLQKVLRKGNLSFNSSYNVLSRVDAISICVPTPLRKSKDPDISCIISALDEIKKHMKSNVLVVLESTTYPGTTEEILKDELENSKRRVGKDFYLAFSPERVDPGNKKYNTKNIPKIIGGITEKCGLVAKSLYENIVDRVVLVDSAKEAEMVKLLENTFRSVNIGLVNEMTMMCDRMGINIWNVIDAAATKPFGYMPFYPGPGIGGHCIPLDPMYLSWKAKAYEFFNRFIELATDINGNMPRFVVSKLNAILNMRGKCLKGSRVLILGIAYKKDVNDSRESPGIEIYKLLQSNRALVDFHDPYIANIDNGSKRVGSVTLRKGKLKQYDCIILASAHQKFDYKNIHKESKLILDCRNAFKGIKSKKIARL